MVENQTYLFLVFSITGVGIGFLFDFFRILRKSFKTHDIITCFEDILFWILTGLIILYNIWYFNNGKIRLFMFIGIIMGTIMYMLILSNILRKVITFIISILKSGILKLLKILVIPFKTIISFITKIFNFIKDFFVRNVKKLQKMQNKRRKLDKNGE